jgi:hypothetical protein
MSLPLDEDGKGRKSKLVGPTQKKKSTGKRPWEKH